MRLINILTNLLLEFRGRTFFLPKIVRGNRTLRIGVSNEQMNKRSGGYDPDDPDNYFMIKSIMSGNWRSGVPNKWLWEIIERNFDDVYNAIDNFYDFESDNNRVIFHGYNDIAGDVEFVADIEARGIGDMALKIITSAISLPNRDFFKNRNSDPIVSLEESTQIENLPVIYLEN